MFRFCYPVQVILQVPKNESQGCVSRLAAFELQRYENKFYKARKKFKIIHY